MATLIAAKGGKLRRLGSHRFADLWPHWPVALCLAWVGSLNVLNGLIQHFATLRQLRTLDEVAVTPLSALGGTVQFILGFMLVVAALGTGWRMISAWALALFLLVVGIGVGALQEQWGATQLFQIFLLVALFWLRRHFLRRTILANTLFSVGGILAVLAYGAFGSYLMGSGFHPKITDLSTAIYFTITTLSTVGYGDIVPVTAEARWFDVTLVTVGLGVFASTVVSALGPKISGELSRLLNPKQKPVEPTDHVILVGEGPIATNTALELAQRGVAFVQIVSAKSPADLENERLIAGDATNDEVLKLAGISRARLVIAARDDDGENAFIVLGAKELNPNVRVMAIASSALSMRRLKLARADLVFSPVAVGSRLLADLVEGNEISPDFRDLLEGHPKSGSPPRPDAQPS